MPSRQLAARVLAEIFAVLAHPDRIRLVEELRTGEKDVSSLAHSLGLEVARVSQHLRLLRVHSIVSERREGRHHLYHLNSPDIAHWIVQGLTYIEARSAVVSNSSIRAARKLWSE